MVVVANEEQEGGRKEGRKEEGRTEATNIKSNNPHLAGGEKAIQKDLGNTASQKRKGV